MQSNRSSYESYKVLFVCLGNICRSPTAEGVFRTLLAEQKVSDTIVVDSVGTGGWHVGKTPDKRACAAAKTRGYDLSNLRARQISAEDFVYFDCILAMDYSNLDELQSKCPALHQHKLKLLLSYAANFTANEVPDPYYGGADGFDHVLDLVEDACAGLFDEIKAAQT